ncbi:PREDICTED: carcinoembryonic antigen-related cell adhesion molecule 7 [Capra hircus]|uniref:carcinoembryonic antigen-related cell adhesion molecule 7 n=1 Tax=Capra hircus TaxID=9925 RepID=UPI000846E5D8|nr:PREDICTED: carcinoembryonic antigen-related cell adhesion molecule 7 [Capra hircus]
MESPTSPASRRHVPWSRLLLAVSLLTFWTPPTTAQVTIETVPRLAAEGSDVLLAHNVSENPLAYSWHRGESVDNTQLIASYRVDNNATTNGSVYSGRETLYPNGTRLIQNVTQKDTGSYTLLVTKKDLQTERQAGHLHVHPVLPTPVITSNNSNPREHEDTVVLTCGSETQNTSYMWWINNQSLPKSMRLKLSKDKRTLILVAVTRNDTGPYVCEARNPVSVSRSDPFTLDVLWQENSRALGVGAITGIVIGVLLVLILLAGLGRFIFLHRGNWPAVSTSGRGPSGSSVSQASLPDARPPAPIYQELLCRDTDVYCRISHKADVGP